MAHPYQDDRQYKVEKRRVATITKGYAAGGAVNSVADGLGRKAKALAAGGFVPPIGGKVPKARLDRPGRAMGGRTQKAPTIVNINVGKQQDQPGLPPLAGLGMPPPMPPPPMPPPPGPPPMPPPGMPPGGPPMGGPPGLPPGIRSMGGRAYAKGGAVKAGPTFREGISEGTKVSHAPGKNDLKQLGRGKPVTYAKGGSVKKN